MTKERFLELQKQHSNNAIAKDGYRLVMTPHFNLTQANNVDALDAIQMLIKQTTKTDDINIEFDTVTGYSINASSNLSTYPMVNGKTVADHMIKQPISISISGIFSLYGNKPTAFAGKDDRLTNIETIFESIQSNGILCTFTTIDRRTNSSTRFKVRNNLVLTNISWTEGQVSLEYNFTFTEALLTTINIPEELPNDETLPAISDAKQLSFTDTLLDFSKVDAIIIKILTDAGIITQDFLNYIATATKNVAVAAGTSALITGGVSAAAAITAVALGASGPVGWAILGIGSAVGAIIGGIIALVNSATSASNASKYKLEQFKLYKEDEKNKAEVERLDNYLSNINVQLQYLNDYLKVYGLSESTEQDCLLYIDNTYYTFSFRKNNTTTNSYTTWTCNIEALDDTLTTKQWSIQNLYTSSLTNIFECNENNAIFRAQTGNGSWIYIINSELAKIDATTYNSNDERIAAKNKAISDLTNYYIFVSTISMSEFNEKLTDIINEAMQL